MAKKHFLLLIIIFLITIGGGIIGIRFLSGDEDTWICQSGQWVKHGNPAAPMPTTGCGEQNEEIVITLPKINEIIASPVSVSGKVRGNWIFEASFPVKIIDANGNELGLAPLQAQSDWMTTDFVPFLGQVSFSKPQTQTGFIIFNNDNPSGDPSKQKEFKLPIHF